MMGSVKIQHFMNKLSGGSLSESESSALLNPSVLGAFREAIKWESTRRSLRTSVAVETIVLSEPLLSTFIEDKQLWAEFVKEAPKAYPIGTNVRAVTQIHENRWAWEEVLKHEPFFSPMINHTPVLAMLGVVGILKDEDLWVKVVNPTYGSRMRQWLYTDNKVRSKQTFTDDELWDRTISNSLTMTSFCNRSESLLHALDSDPAKFRKGPESVRHTALMSSTAIASTVKNHPRFSEIVPNEDLDVLRGLTKKLVKPFRMTYAGDDGSIVCIDDQGAEVWKKPLSITRAHAGIPDGSGYVRVRSVGEQTYEGLTVLDHVTWDGVSGDYNVQTLTLPQTKVGSQPNRPVVSHNSRYVSFVYSNKAVVVDLQTHTIVTDITLSGVSVRAYAVDDSGVLYVGGNAGVLKSYSLGGTLVLDTIFMNASNVHITCVHPLGAGKLLVARYSQSIVYVVDSSDGTVISQSTKTGRSIRDGHGGVYYNSTESCYYFVGGYQGNIFKIDETTDVITWVTASTSSRTYDFSCGYVDSQGTLHLIDSTSYSTITPSANPTNTNDVMDNLGDNSGNNYGVVQGPNGGVYVGMEGHVPIDANLRPVRDEWGPSPYHDVAGRVEWVNEEPYLLIRNLVYKLDRDTGETIGGIFTPSIGDGVGGLYETIEPGNSGSDVTLCRSGELAYVHYNRGQCVTSKDGEILWIDSRDSSDSRYLTEDLALRTDGHLLIASGTNASVYNYLSGRFVSTIALSTNGAGAVCTTFKDQFVISPVLGVKGSYYTRTTDIGSVSMPYMGHNASGNTYRPYSSNNTIEDAKMIDDFFVSSIDGVSSAVLKMTQFNVDTDATIKDDQISSSWLSTNTTLSAGKVKGFTYNPETDSLYCIYGSTLAILTNWRNGDASVSANSVTLTTPNTYTNTKNRPQSSYGRIELGN